MVAGQTRCLNVPPPLPKLPLVLGGERAHVLAVGGTVGLQATDLNSNIFTAAKERKERKKVIVSPEPDGYPWVERSELCEEARQAVRGWAQGKFSGRQCLLLLERSAEVARLLEDDIQTGAAREDAEEEERQTDAGLWVNGCPGLGGSGPGLGVFAAYLELNTPKDALADAWHNVETQCGASASLLGAGEINLALRRLSQRARRSGPDPTARFLQVQLWRELLQVSTDMARSQGEVENDPRQDVFPICTEGNSVLGQEVAVIVAEEDPSFQLEEDRGLLQWLACSEVELKHRATRIPTAQLQRDVLTAEKYAVQVLRLSNRLRRAIEGWSQFDAYRILGVCRSASMAEIRRAFYKKALQTHPDKGGEKEAFQELQSAYNEILDEKGANRQRCEHDNEDINENSNDEAKEWEQWQKEQEERETRRKRQEEETRRKAEEAKKRQEEQENKPKPATQNKDDNEAEDTDDEEERVGDLQDTDDELAADRKKGSGRRTCQQQKQRRVLKKLAREVQEASEMAGEHATRALRRCHAVIDMLEGGKVESERVWVSAAQALQDTGRVATATKVTGQNAGAVAGILELLSEEHARCEGLIDAPCAEPRSSPDILSDAARGAAAAASASNAAAAECAAASMRSSASLSAARCRGSTRASDPGILQRAVHRAIHPILDVVKAAAVAALEAAEICTEACAALEKAACTDKDSQEAEDSAHNETSCEEKENKTESTETASQEDAQTLKSVAETKAELEARRASAAWLDIQRVLRRANTEMLELLARTRKLFRRDPSVVPQLSSEQRSRLFALLAEFLDAAALHFHTMLQQGVPPLGPLVRKALERAFGFMLTAEPHLAVSVDPRMQVLRAALALDAERVRDMLKSQLRRRLESSVTFVCSTRGSMHAAEAQNEAAPELESMHDELVAALEKLSTPIQ